VCLPWANGYIRIVSHVNIDQHFKFPFWSEKWLLNNDHFLTSIPQGSISSTFYKCIFLYESLLSSFFLLRVWLWTNFRTKNAHVKCWWNWTVQSLKNLTLCSLLNISHVLINFNEKLFVDIFFSLKQKKAKKATTCLIDGCCS